MYVDESCYWLKLRKNNWSEVWNKTQCGWVISEKKIVKNAFLRDIYSS